MENNAFTYRYSAAQNKEVECIRKKYLSKEPSKLDTLRMLDRKVQSAGTLEGLILGVIGCLIFGIGLCFGLDVLVGADWVTFLFGGIGAPLMLAAYPVYKRISKKRKAELTPRILELSDELINS